MIGRHQKKFTRIPMSVSQLAEAIPKYSHTPDGINYRRDTHQLLVYVDWDSGRVDISGCRDDEQQLCRHEIESRDATQLFMIRTTTTVHATDVYTREPIVRTSLYPCLCDFIYLYALIV